MLTLRQRELLLFIHRRLRQDGIAPSYDEMKDALQLKSKSGVHRMMDSLEERGFLRRLKRRARALEVIRLPPGAAEPLVPPPDNAATSPAGALAHDSHGSYGKSVTVAPLYGRIAAGTPLEALRDESAFVELPTQLTGGGDCYALEVEGDSMIGAGIHNGDIAIIERCQTAENGAIVIALIDGEIATLKRLRRKGQSIALEAANPAYDTRLFGAKRVRIQGRLAAIIRRYRRSGL